MLCQLKQVEFAMRKSEVARKTNERQLKKYESLYEEIEVAITKAVKDIENAKIELKEARTVRQHRMEYDALAEIIKTQPDRKETQQQLAEKQKQLHALQV